MKEKQEIDLLNKEGFVIETKKISLFKYFGKKTRKWRVSFMSFGLMDLQSKLFYKMNINEDKLSSENYNDVFSEQKRIVRENVKNCSKVVALAVVCSFPCVHWGMRSVNIYLLQGIFSRYFLWRLDSQKLLQFAQDIHKQYDLQSFMTSIALMHEKRITKEQIEK